MLFSPIFRNRAGVELQIAQSFRPEGENPLLVADFYGPKPAFQLNLIRQ